MYPWMIRTRKDRSKQIFRKKVYIGSLLPAAAGSLLHTVMRA